MDPSSAQPQATQPQLPEASPNKRHIKHEPNEHSQPHKDPTINRKNTRDLDHDAIYSILVFAYCRWRDPGHQRPEQHRAK